MKSAAAAAIPSQVRHCLLQNLRLLIPYFIRSLLSAECYEHFLQTELLDAHIILIRDFLTRLKKHGHAPAASQPFFVVQRKPCRRLFHFIFVPAYVKTPVQQLLRIFFQQDLSLIHNNGLPPAHLPPPR